MTTSIPSRLAAFLVASALLACTAAAKTKAPESGPATAPASQPASQPTAGATSDPFLQLQVVVPKDKLPPLSSVRVRDKREEKDRSREGKVTITITSKPKGARVYYGGKLLGTTPMSLSAKRGSTPFDVVLRAGGYMTLHTRIRRKTNRNYHFKLSPAKIR